MDPPCMRGCLTLRNLLQGQQHAKIKGILFAHCKCLFGAFRMHCGTGVSLHDMGVLEQHSTQWRQHYILQWQLPLVAQAG